MPDDRARPALARLRDAAARVRDMLAGKKKPPRPHRPPALPVLSIPATASAVAGSVLALPVSKSGAGACSAAVSAWPLTAMPGADYGRPPDAVAFGAADRTRVLRVQIPASPAPQGQAMPRTFRLLLSSPTACTISNDTCTVTINDLPPAFFVAPGGSDAATGKAPSAGTTDGPVATLGRALELARADATIDTIYVRGGTYALSSKLTLLAADAGLKIKAFGAETPVLHGGGTLHTIMQFVDTSNITVKGLTFSNGLGTGMAVECYQSSGCRFAGNRFTQCGTAIKFYNAANGVVAGNTMEDLGGFGVEIDGGPAGAGGGHKVYHNIIRRIGTANSQAAAVGGHGCPDNIAAFNDIEDCARYGVSWKDFSTTAQATNCRTMFNRILRTNNAGGDTGGIEFLGRSNVAHGHRAEGNYIDDTGGLILENGIGASGVYLDDLTNSTVVKGNFIRKTTWTHWMVHGGDNNTFENNFCIIGTGEKATVISNNGNIPTGSVATGNAVQKNIFYGLVSVATPHQLNNTGVNVVDNNLLHNVTRMAGVDVNSVIADPLFVNAAAGDFRLQSGSPALGLGITDLQWSLMGRIGYNPTTAATYSLPDYTAF